MEYDCYIPLKYLLFQMKNLVLRLTTMDFDGWVGIRRNITAILQ